jgi:sensor histidine kinase YesM
MLDKMEYLKSKKTRKIVLHLFLWSVSLNIWYSVFNPGVESSGIIKGLDENWPVYLMINYLFILFCLLPFAWLIRPLKKWLKTAATVIFIIPFIYFVYLWIFPQEGNKDLSDFIDLFISRFLYVIVFHLTIVAAVYVNLRKIIPEYVAGNRLWVYLFSFAGLSIGAALLNFGIFNLCLDKIFPSIFFISYFNPGELVLIMAAYLVFTTVLHLIWQYREMLIANRDKTHQELSNLKAQVNPHFLFNNLNTIYALSSTNSEHTREVILKLSDFLRYVLYDTGAESIPLEKEIEIISIYVELQKERIDQAITKVSLTQEGDFGKARIAPLLLLPLTENCFKFGAGNQPGEISITISCRDKVLRFLTLNTISRRPENEMQENGGIGIKNVEKRLHLLYPDRHSLRLEEKDGIFRAELTVKLT